VAHSIVVEFYKEVHSYILEGVRLMTALSKKPKALRDLNI